MSLVEIPVRLLKGPLAGPFPMVDGARWRRERWDEDDAVLFWSGSDGDYKELSNFYAGHQPFWMPCRHNPSLAVPARTGEHAFHFGKALTLDDVIRVAAAPSPLHAKKECGRGKMTLPAGWDARLRCPWMLEVVRHKFSQDEELRELLLGTGERLLVEDSPYDDFWGGRDKTGGYTGQNMLGRALMRLRDELCAGA